MEKSCKSCSSCQNLHFSLRVAALGLCAGLFMRIADWAEGGGGGYNGGGIAPAAPNHSILYPLSMLYDSIAASMPDSSSLAVFQENEAK
jgi:hypothetical protein